MSAKESRIDIIQAIGRVLRKAPGKKYGYIIIPVFIPPNTDGHIALENNENYKTLWNILNAIRAHDDSFDSMINQLRLNTQKYNSKIAICAPRTFEYEFDMSDELCDRYQFILKNYTQYE